MTKSALDRQYAQNCPNRFGILGVQNLLHSRLSQLANRTEVVVFQPLGHIGVPARIPRKLDYGDYRISVPFDPAAVAIYADEMRYRSIGRFANVSLVMKFIPQAVPDCSGTLSRLKLHEQKARVEAHPVAAVESHPMKVVPIEHLREV